MKRIFIQFTALTALFLLGCNNSNPIDPNAPPTDETRPVGLVTEVGRPIGPATEQTIGPAGGQLSVADGKFTLIFPAGAVDRETRFKVQPVENKAPGGIGPAYEIEPKLEKLAKPIQFVRHYGPDDFPGSAPEAVGIAYQDAQRIWHGRVNVSVDKTARTLSTPVFNLAHPLAWYEQFFMKPETANLLTGQTQKIEIWFVEGRTEKTKDDLDVPMPGVKKVERMLNRDEVRDWRVNGLPQGKPGQQPDRLSGHVTPEASGAEATYYAPAAIPPRGFNPVAISVELNLKSKGQIILVSHFLIEGAGKISIGSAKYDSIDVVLSHSAEAKTLGGSLRARINPNSTQAVTEINFQIRDFKGPGRYAIQREADGNSKCTISALDGTPDAGVWSHAYIHSPPPYGQWGPGSVEIQEFDGKYVKGKVQATLHNNKPYDHRTINVSGEFRGALRN
ncbi:hypothetical protein ACO2Q8_25845 [Larkinella sp. VNQ87]|uniref:hypothetical protein n=1 Tax=Larkinella sp. VNQ87 TaxID=3400921 RepID=UPI003BFDC5B1